MSTKQPKIYIAGHAGMVGSAIHRELVRQGQTNVVTRTRSELDLCNQQAVAEFFEQEKPEHVYLAAAKVGGIHANNTYPADFISQNLQIQSNIIHSAYLAEATKLLFLGSSCIYPQLAEQPMRESALLTGALEPTNEPYAIAKIAGIKMCESYNRQYGTDFRSAMPTNIYGVGDNFHPENSHVVAALIRRIHEAKLANSSSVTIWGSGAAMREFLNADDLGSASVFLMNLDKSIYDEHTEPMLSHVNVGTGVDCTIRELAESIVEVVGYSGSLQFDTTKPDGTPKKLLDVSLLSKLGWEASITLKDGLKQTYDWFQQQESVRAA
ncbi:MAG TPA: GDP-fucose synthetase [Gammaproteobacteria bacterium]|jgi:GDP-L-fucose synthase|nr:GDP-fucose synthetase [Gammaproteobacteria bacterium]